MSNRLISIIIGAILTISMGFLVFATKNPAVLPSDKKATETVIGGIPQTPVIKSISTKYKINDDDDDDENYSAPADPIAVSSYSSQVQVSSDGITISQISQHDSRASCWSAINGRVYDLTSWIPNHPGGERSILSLCGVDGSAGYNDQHGRRSNIAMILTGFKIGTLAN